VVSGTRVPYDLVAGLVRDGIPPENIKDYYPSLVCPLQETWRLLYSLGTTSMRGRLAFGRTGREGLGVHKY